MLRSLLWSELCQVTTRIKNIGDTKYVLSVSPCKRINPGKSDVCILPHILHSVFGVIFLCNQSLFGHLSRMGRHLWRKQVGSGEADIWVLKLKPDGPIDPSCDFGRNTNLSVGLSIATSKSPSVSVKDSNATSQDSSAVIQDTNVPVNILCASTVAE